MPTLSILILTAGDRSVRVNIRVLPFDSSGSLTGWSTCFWHIVPPPWQFWFADWLVDLLVFYILFFPLTFGPLAFDILFSPLTFLVCCLVGLLAFHILVFPLTVSVRWLGGPLVFAILFFWHIDCVITGWSTCLWYIVLFTYWLLCLLAFAFR